MKVLRPHGRGGKWLFSAPAALLLSGLSPAAGAADPPAGSSSATASGGDAASVKVAAEDLYDQGIALTKQGKWAEAAVKLEESNRLERAPGTTLNLANCYEQLGKLASAWTLYVEAAGIFGGRTPPDPRGALAQERADALKPRLSRLTIEVPPEVAALSGLEVRRDGQKVGAGQFGTAIAVDAGPHVIEVSAPGKEPWKTEVKVGAGAAKETIRIPSLSDAKPTEGGAAGGWPWQKKVAVGAAGAGLLGVVVGAAFGADALGKHDELQKQCTPGTPRACTAAGIETANAQSTVATISTAGFAAGGALIAAGVVLWLVAPPSEGVRQSAPRVWLAPSVGAQTGVVVGGVF
jgi:hypothetical protein